jgi:hypothetical protein
MKLATWLSVVVLGPGSLAIFVWFLLDVKRVFGRRRAPSEEASDGGSFAKGEP